MANRRRREELADEQLGNGTFYSLTFPARGFPALGKREFDFPATTTFRLYIDQLNPCQVL